MVFRLSLVSLSAYEVLHGGDFYHLEFFKGQQEVWQFYFLAHLLFRDFLLPLGVWEKRFLRQLASGSSSDSVDDVVEELEFLFLAGFKGVPFWEFLRV